ncbi:MAG TPA: universal stress protein [Herpetosiphonaceae bacterium]
MYRSILVPLDGSAFSEYALPVARAIIRRLPADQRATLHLVRVHEPIITTYIDGLPIIDEELDAQMRKHEEEYLNLVHTRLMHDIEIDTRCAVIDGPTAAMLIQHIKAEQIDLVVMTTHGRGGMARFWLGSTADEVVRHGAAPVLMIRPPSTPVVAAEEPTFQRVLIPLDGSEIAEDILEHAAMVGGLIDAEYRLLRIVEPLMMVGYSPTAYSADLEKQVVRQQIDEAETYLASIAQRLQAQGLRVSTKVVVGQQPVTIILKAAHEYRIDLIAMATHGRGGLSRLLLGSTADKVLRGALVPVLLHHPLAKRGASEATPGKNVALSVGQ